MVTDIKVLLIYPEYPKTYWSFHYALKFISKRASLPPLGLVTVASILPGDWEKKLVDMNISPLKDRDIQWADYVFISAMAIQRDSVSKVIAQCKKLGTKIVAGGPLFTTEHEVYEAVDHLILNEGEITIPCFLKDIEAGKPKKIYTSSEWADIEKTPVPLWELLDIKKYASMNIQYSRGCPFSCDFCSVTELFGHSPRTKTGRQLIDELEALYQNGWRGHVFFVDDNFIGNKKKLKENVLPLLITWMEKRKYPFVFSTETSINLSDDEELMKLMVKAGFNTVFVGIETPNEESLAECNKLQNRGRDMVACVKKIQKNGLQVQGGFIVGFDNDSVSVFEKLIGFIQECGIVTAMVGLLNAPQGTKLYKRLSKEGRIIDGFTGDNTDFTMNFLPRMNYDTLIKGYKSVVSTLYSPKYYYARILKFLKEYNPSGLGSPRISPSHINALLKSFIRLGIMGKERVYYWKLVLWSLLKKPRAFPLAITFSIYGFHFRKIYEK